MKKQIDQDLLLEKLLSDAENKLSDNWISLKDFSDFIYDKMFDYGIFDKKKVENENLLDIASSCINAVIIQLNMNLVTFHGLVDDYFCRKDGILTGKAAKDVDDFDRVYHEVKSEVMKKYQSSRFEKKDLSDKINQTLNDEKIVKNQDKLKIDLEHLALKIGNILSKEFDAAKEIYLKKYSRNELESIVFKRVKKEALKLEDVEEIALKYLESTDFFDGKITDKEDDFSKKNYAYEISFGIAESLDLQVARGLRSTYLFTKKSDMKPEFEKDIFYYYQVFTRAENYFRKIQNSNLLDKDFFNLLARDYLTNNEKKAFDAISKEEAVYTIERLLIDLREEFNINEEKSIDYDFDSLN